MGGEIEAQGVGWLGLHIDSTCSFRIETRTRASLTGGQVCDHYATSRDALGTPCLSSGLQTLAHGGMCGQLHVMT